MEPYTSPAVTRSCSVCWCHRSSLVLEASVPKGGTVCCWQGEGAGRTMETLTTHRDEGQKGVHTVLWHAEVTPIVTVGALPCVDYRMDYFANLDRCAGVG